MNIFLYILSIFLFSTALIWGFKIINTAKGCGTNEKNIATFVAFFAVLPLLIFGVISFKSAMGVS